MATPASTPPTATTPELIERPNTLKERVGGSLKPELATRAEKAVQDMSGDFNGWLTEIANKVLILRQAQGPVDLTSANRGELYTATLELKSLGGTYGYPLLTRFAQSLCKLLIKLNDEQVAPARLVDAHIDAMRAVLRDKLTRADDPLGTRLAEELEKQVRALVD